MSAAKAEAQKCRECGKPWRGIRLREVWTELDRQDHKGPKDVAYAECCGRQASEFGATPIPASIGCAYCMDTGRRGFRHDGLPCNSCGAGRKVWASYGL